MGNTPNIRFKGFTDDWEQRKLGEEAIEIIAGGDIDKEKVVEEGRYPIYANALTNDGIVGYYNEYYRVKAPAVTVTGRGEVGRAQARMVDFTPVVRLLAIRSHHDSYFLENAINNHKVVVESTGVPQLTVPQLSSYDIFFPSSIEEEAKIGEYFHRLDNLITLHQRKQSCNTLFINVWEQRKLMEYLEVSKEKNKDEAFGKEDVLSVSGDYGIVNQIEFQGRSFAGVSVAPYGVVETGDIVYTKSPLKSNPYGIIKTNKGKPGIVSTLYAVYKPLDNVYSEFVQIYFEQDARMNNYMHPLVNKGAKNDMKVSDENALKGEVCFPCRDEQIKISEYFAKLDNLITLHQRKCDEIKEIKKFMLQNMFPQKG